ncbi:MAG: PilN domain-containing protein [Myxococcota bacterium]
MIRINLLPVKQARKRETGLQQVILMGMTLALALFIMVGYNFKVDGDIDALQEEIQRQEAEVARLEKIIGEVNQYEAQKQKLLAQLKVIEELEKGKSGPVKVLDALATGIPKRVWIESFQENGGVATIQGFGLEMADVSEFLKALEKSPHFTNVQLKYTENVPQKGLQTFRFQLTTNVNYAI